MTGLLLASYILLWVIVVAVALVVVGTLRQFVLFQRSFSPDAEAQNPSLLSIEDDGPLIGSPLPDLEVHPHVSGDELSRLREHDPGVSTLIFFLSPRCSSCQGLIEPINALATDPQRQLRIFAIVKGEEQACRAFIRIFPLRKVVTYLDENETISRAMGVMISPFGLFYDSNDVLVRKGAPINGPQLMALIGDEDAPEDARHRVFPPLTHSSIVTDRELSTPRR